MFAVLVLPMACGSDDSDSGPDPASAAAAADAEDDAVDETSSAQAASIVAEYKRSIGAAMEDFGPCDMSCLGPDSDAMDELASVHRDIKDLGAELRQAEPYEDEIAALVERTVTAVDERLAHWSEYTEPCIDFEPTGDEKADTIDLVMCVAQPEVAERTVREFLDLLARWDPYL